MQERMLTKKEVNKEVIQQVTTLAYRRALNPNKRGEALGELINNAYNDWTHWKWVETFNEAFTQNKFATTFEARELIRLTMFRILIETHNKNMNYKEYRFRQTTDLYKMHENLKKLNNYYPNIVSKQNILNQMQTEQQDEKEILTEKQLVRARLIIESLQRKYTNEEDE